MLDKLTSNQRLLLAVAVSFLFFVGYTMIFPPKNMHKIDNNVTTKTVNEKTSQVSQATHSSHDVATATTHLVSSKNNTLVTVLATRYTLKIDTLGRIASMTLSNDKYDNKQHHQAELIEPDGVKPLYIKFENSKLNAQSLKTPYETTAQTINATDKPATVTLVQKLPSLTVTKKLTFYKDGHYDIAISLSRNVKYLLDLGQRPKVSEKMMTVAGAMVYHGDGKTKIFEDGDVKEKTVFNHVHFISSFDQYFADVIYGFNPKVGVSVGYDDKHNPLVSMDGIQNMQFHGYIGPKTYTLLKKLDPVLVNTVEYGWFTFAARPLFSVLLWLDSIFGNWGWAIVALTFLVRLVLYPLTYKGMVSMQKMKLVAPKIKEIQAKYKGDAQRTNAAVMAEYKKSGVNPLGGCLPMVLQIPVFFAMYRVFLNAPELQGAPWIFWVHDLARMDHLFILPVLMGATMFYQQHITPNNFTDPLQAKVFKFLPVIFTFFFVTFPAGLVLYWLTNNLASIAQQYLVNRRFAVPKANTKVDAKSLEK